MLDTLRRTLADHRPPANPRPIQRAAVLVPLFERGGEARVLLTRRSDALRSHSGQVSFPGGKCDPEDGGPAGTALREAREEVGLDPAAVEVIGELDEIVSRNYYLVRPVVGVIPADFAPEPNPVEIDSVFDVPLSFFMDPANHVGRVMDIPSYPHISHHFQYGPYDVWGLTAMVILRLLEVGLGHRPEYEVHHPGAPKTWMEWSQLYAGERLWD